MNLLAIGEDERLVDPGLLAGAIIAGRFAGVELAEPARTRLLELISFLAGKGPISIGALRRFVPPILGAIADKPHDLAEDVARFTGRLILVPRETTRETPAPAPEAEPTLTAEKRRRRFTLRRAAIAFLTFLLILGIASVLTTSRPDTGQQPVGPPPSAAQTGTAPRPENTAAEKPSGQVLAAHREPVRLNDRQRLALLRAAAGGPLSASELAVRHPDFQWLPQAAEQAGWQQNDPLPLHNQQFVVELFGLASQAPAAETGKSDDAGMRAFAAKVSQVAAQTPAARVWASLHNPGVAHDRRTPVRQWSEIADKVFARDLDSPWTVHELAQFTRDRARPGSPASTASDEVIARAWQIAASDVQRTLALGTRTAEPTVARDRKAGKAFALYLLALGLAAALYRLRRTPLELALLLARRNSLAVVPSALAPSPAQDPAWLRSWRRTLSNPVPQDYVLDIDATVSATAAANGFAELRYKRQRALPSFAVAVERQGARDAFTRWWTSVFEAVARAGVAMTLATYRDGMDLVRWAIGASAEGLRERGLRRQLIVVGSSSQGEALLSPSYRLVPSGSHVLAPPSRTGNRVQAQMALLMDENPLTEPSSQYLFEQDRNWLDETPVADEEWRQLRGALILHLGIDGFRWLAGCSIAPLIDERFVWDVAQTLAIGTELSDRRRIACRLVALPWLRAGRMPNWLRYRFQEEMGEDDLLALEAMVKSQLARGEQRSSAGNGPSDVSAPRRDLPLEGDRLLTQMAMRAGGILTPRSVPDRFRSLLVPGLWRRLRSEVRWIIPLVFLALGARFFAPALPQDLSETLVGAIWTSSLLCAFIVCYAAAAALYATSERGDWNRVRGMGILELAVSCFDRKLWTERPNLLHLGRADASGHVNTPVSGTTWRAELRTLRIQAISSGARALLYVLTVGAASLACYMVSLRVATERADVAKIERQIILTRHDIRQLEIEIETRSRLEQLETWNKEVLGLSAPSAAQFVRTPGELARFYRAPAPAAASEIKRSTGGTGP